MNKHLKNILEGKKINHLEKQVFIYIINNISNCLDVGVREIAKANFTSTTTVMRLSSKLGYKGFVDMIYNIAPLINNYDDDASEVYFNKLNLSSILKYNSDLDMNYFIELMNNQKNGIYIFSTGFSNTLGEYMYKKLLMTDIRMYYSNGNDSIGIFTSKIVTVDMFIAFSKSGETQTVVNRANYAKNLGIPIISFTNESKNTLASISDINFKIYDHYKADDDNIMGSNYFPDMLMLVEYIYHKYKNSK